MSNMKRTSNHNKNKKLPEKSSSRDAAINFCRLDGAAAVNDRNGDGGGGGGGGGCNLQSATGGKG